jgi:hypothetical protein
MVAYPASAFSKTRRAASWVADPSFCFRDIGECKTESQIGLEEINAVSIVCGFQIGKVCELGHAPFSRLWITRSVLLKYAN